MKRKKTLKMLLLLLSPLLLFGAYVIGVLIYGSFHDWKPEEKIVLSVSQSEAKPQAIGDSVFSFMTWNIGYAGLGSEVDFFYDGGNMVRSSKEQVDNNIEGISKELAANEGLNFFLLQEVDQYSKRSYYQNEFDTFQQKLMHYHASLALNFNVPFVPKKYFDPIGHVESGIASFSKYCPSSATRYQFPGEFSWPLRLFNLDRCFMASRFPLQNGKELVVINTHNSAYDDGSMKKQEMAYLKRFLMTEYELGNYIVVGGDWNQCPPGFQWDKFAKQKETEDIPLVIEKDFMPSDWTWAFDDKTASNRKLKTKFEPSKTFTTLIDFFLLSPNMELITVKGKDLGFAHSDHQPVFIECRLK